MGLRDASAITALPANDVERAKRFYADKLGLTPVLEDPARVVFAQADGSQFLLFPTPNTNRGGHSQMGLRVSDIEHEVAELKARGVAFDEYDSGPLKTTNSIADNDGVRAAWFKDSEGNTIGIVQPPR